MEIPNDVSRIVSIMVLVGAGDRIAAEWVVATVYGDVLRFRDRERMWQLAKREHWQITDHQTVQQLAAKHLAAANPLAPDFEALSRPATPAEKAKIEDWRVVAKSSARACRAAAPAARAWYARLCLAADHHPEDLLRLWEAVVVVSRKKRAVARDPLGWLMQTAAGSENVLHVLAQVSRLDGPQ